MSLIVAVPVAGLFGWACVVVIAWWLLRSQGVQLNRLCSLQSAYSGLAEPGSDGT